MGSSVEASERARRAAPWIHRGGGALLMSAAVHAAAAVSIGGVLAFAPAAPGPNDEPATVAVTVMSLADRPLPQSAPTPAPAAHATVSTHRRLVAHAAPALPQPPVRVLPPPPQPIATPPADEPRPIFALSAGTVASGPALAVPSAASPVLSPGLTTRSSTSQGDTASSEAATATEGDVDVPARLLSAAPLAYPPAARQSEIELDFPLEIVVDASGRVVSARALSRAGYGLDEAALQGIRGYRFSPALRAGRPIAVRMRWTVQFRLR
jgi:periplasmic protein TonB